MQRAGSQGRFLVDFGVLSTQSSHLSKAPQSENKSQRSRIGPLRARFLPHECTDTNSGLSITTVDFWTISSVLALDREISAHEVRPQ